MLNTTLPLPTKLALPYTFFNSLKLENVYFENSAYQSIKGISANGYLRT